jgi:hypothetical protein
MKYLLILVLSSTILMCESSKKATIHTPIEATVLENCPEDGTCTFEVFQNKSLNIQKDDLGAFYPEVVDGKKTVIKFEYKRNEIPNTADGNYSEIIYAEINPQAKEITLQDDTLIEAKLLFGRLCFCRGETGYYYVNKGLLNISSNTDGTKTYTLTFKINEVPQIITSFYKTL